MKKPTLAQMKIMLRDKELPVTMHPIEERQGNQLVKINPNAFDKAFQKNDWQYVGKEGKGGIEGRYKRFGDFVKDAPSMRASNAQVNKNGSVVFGDGRHRYAYLRDQGLESIPMSMDKQSIAHAKTHGYLHEANGGTVMGINVKSDTKAGRRYADMIVDGHKTLESRNGDTLRPYVGKRVAIVRTGEGPAKAIGEVTIGEPMVANKKKFRSLEEKHHVPEGSAFDINTPTKHLYPMHDPVRYEEERDVGHGIIARKVIHKAQGGKIKGAHMKPTLAQMRLRLADGGSSTATQPTVTQPTVTQPTVTQPTGTSSTTNTQTTQAMQDQIDAARNLKLMYGIDNPALVNYITSNPYGAKGALSGTELKDLSTAFNTKSAQDVNNMQTSDSQPLYAQAQQQLQSQAADIQRKKDLANPNSWIYQKGLTIDPYAGLNDNKYSKYAIGSVFAPSGPANYDRTVDDSGVHITTGEGTYLLNPKSNRIVSFALNPNDPRSSATEQQRFYDFMSTPLAEGGTVNQRPMSEPTLAQMRLEMGRHRNPQVMGNIGVDEAVDIDPKIFVNPNPSSPGLPDIGGVKTPEGALPVGGIDMNPMQAGQQMMPQQPPQQGQLGQQPQQGQPQGQPSGAPPSMAPAGMGAPQGPSNILSLTPQGQAMNAMRPPMMPKMAKGGMVGHFAKGGSKKEKPEESKRILVKATGPNGIKGIVIPRHMLEGKTYGGTGPKAGQKVEGLLDLNKARAEVYGSENRQPLNIGQMGRIHKQVLSDHFAKPIDEQTAAEKEALERLRKAKHIGSKANTLDESEKLDTVRHETDDQGRTHVGYAAKGIAGHALYSSGSGKNENLHVLNTCPGQVDGCGGGIDQNGIVDTKRGSCFAPNAESQYVNAAVRRAAHAQAKHDPAMTRDWVLAHTGSLREAADEADKNNQRLLFRPNVVDESDTSSRHVLRGLNEQRKKEDKPPIIANSYGKTNELHDPENHYHVTHSNVGPKTKHGKEITESIKRDKARVRNTILARDNQGDFVNEQGNKTPPKNSYMVTNVKRGSPFDKDMQNTITHAKYWSIPRPLNELTEMEKDEGSEGHYDGKGKPTTPDKSHYGHMVIGDNRYDYQKQHILHPRLVQVGTNNDGTPHMIPTDSRFLDNKELDKKIPRSKQFKTKNGKRAGLILMTTPTESTPNHEHHSSFTHDVNPTHLEYAKKNNGEYEIDPPLAQEFARSKEYVAPEPMKMVKKTWATGGAVHSSLKNLAYHDDFNAFPETNFASQHHLAKRRATKE